MKRLLLYLALTTFVCPSIQAQQGYSTDYFGEATEIPLDSEKKAPVDGLSGDVFGSELYIDGRTDANLDLLSIQADLYQQQQRVKEQRKQRDQSIRKNIISGEPVQILIAPDHYVQLTFMKDGEIVFPRRAYPAEPQLLVIRKEEGSPFLYIKASVMMENQTTNLFVETEEDGRVQTYVLNLRVTKPKDIREQVQVNLVNDLTPPIRGGTGSEAERARAQREALNLQPTIGPDGAMTSTPKIGPGNVHRRFTREDVKMYFNTMIQMAQQYGEAKEIERQTGRITYRDSDIMPYPGSKVTYVDPIDGCQWRIREIWYFPRYDAVLLGTVCYNPTAKTSMWDYSQMKWRVDNSQQRFDTTSAAPVSMQTPSKKTNVVWYLLQGYRIDPMAEYSPVFPRADKRGHGPPTPRNPQKGDRKFK